MSVSDRKAEEPLGLIELIEMMLTARDIEELAARVLPGLAQVSSTFFALTRQTFYTILNRSEIRRLVFP